MSVVNEANQANGVKGWCACEEATPLTFLTKLTSFVKFGSPLP